MISAAAALRVALTEEEEIVVAEAAQPRQTRRSLATNRGETRRERESKRTGPWLREREWSEQESPSKCFCVCLREVQVRLICSLV